MSVTSEAQKGARDTGHRTSKELPGAIFGLESSRKGTLALRHNESIHVIFFNSATRSSVTSFNGFAPTFKRTIASMSAGGTPDIPSKPWRYASTSIMGFVGILSRGFLYGLSRTETEGLNNFLQILDERESVENRERGLITGECRDISLSRRAQRGGLANDYCQSRIMSACMYL
jgi:hypothetical protein